MIEAGRKGVTYQRYKGLGEMNPDQLWETTLDVNARSLLQVKIREVDAADDIFTKLMGDVVEPRREFIQDNSLQANVDVLRRRAFDRTTMANETATLAAYVADLRYDDIPAEVAARAKALTLDFLGSAVRARRDAESTPSLLATLAALGLDGAGGATVCGDARTYSPAVAALLNGAFGHSLDFDDTHADSSLHPSAPVVPAALAVGEIVEASGRDVLTAIVAGYEVCCRLGNALDPTALTRGLPSHRHRRHLRRRGRGAKLYGLSAERIVAAFGVSGSQAAGSLQFLLNGAWNKRYQVGAAALNGVIAATLARNGFVARPRRWKAGTACSPATATTPIPKGGGRARPRLRDHEHRREALSELPLHHAAIDALIALRREHNLTPDTIRRVEIGLHRNVITLTGDAATKRHARSVVDGQFSMFFTAALALDQGSFGWDDYARLGDPAIEALADKIAVVQDARLEGRSHPFGARVSIDAGGETLERLVPDPSGEPSLFPDAPAMRQKFLQLARPVLDGGAERFADAILALDSVARVDAVTALARP